MVTKPKVDEPMFSPTGFRHLPDCLCSICGGLTHLALFWSLSTIVVGCCGRLLFFSSSCLVDFHPFEVGKWKEIHYLDFTPHII